MILFKYFIFVYKFSGKIYNISKIKYFTTIYIWLELDQSLKEIVNLS